MTLIERLEAATGPDRELDAAILVAVGGKRRFDDWWIGYRFIGREASAFTASIDAALTLVPEGWDYVIASPGVDENHPDEWCINMARHPDDESNFTFAPTPALAICIAALKAKGE